MISLLLETSTEFGLVALFKDKQLICEETLPPGLQNSKYIFTGIQKALSSFSLNPKDLNLIIAGVGPGSYTGIRVSAITAKTLSFALQIPLVGISSLNGFIPQNDGVFASIIDARIGGVYIKTGVMEHGVCRWTTCPMLYSLNEAFEFLKEIKTFVTPSSLLLKPKFNEVFKDQITWIESAPNCEEMGRTAFEKFERGDYTLNQELELLYLRKTQAEIERETFLRKTGF